MYNLKKVLRIAALPFLLSYTSCKENIQIPLPTQDSMPNTGDMSRSDGGSDVGKDKIIADLGVDVARYDVSRDMRVDVPTDIGLDGRIADLGVDIGVPDIGRDMGTDVSADLGLDGRIADLGVDIGVPDMGLDGPRPPRPYECDPFTIVLYRFDQPSPFVDSCGAHDLMNSGTTEISGQAGFGEARSFDGIDDYLDTPPTEDLNFGSMLDFRIRANMRTTAPLTSYDTIMGKTAGSPTATGYSIFYYSGNGWSCLYWDTDRTEQVNSLATLNDGLWHEIMCERTNNGTRATIYIDGLEIATTTITPANTDSSAPLVIGNMRHGIERSQGYFEGEVDGVEIERIE